MWGWRGNQTRDSSLITVGAHERREAAMAKYQADRHRGFAVLVRSYGLDVAQRFLQRLAQTLLNLPQRRSLTDLWLNTPRL